MKDLLQFMLHPPEWTKPPDWMILILWVCFAYTAFKLLMVAVPIVPLWCRAAIAGVKISWLELFGMWLRNGRAGARTIVDSLVAAKACRLSVNPVDVEAHHLAKGDAAVVIAAMSAARKAGVPLEWQEASMLELQGRGRELLEAVRQAKDSNDASPLNALLNRAKS